MMAKTSDFEKLKTCLTEIGIKFHTTDDSYESEIGEGLDTVIVLEATPETESDQDVYIFFTREGKYRNEIDIV